MKIKIQSQVIFLLILSLFTFGCGLTGPAPLSPTAKLTQPPPATITAAPPATDTPTAAPSSTGTLTPTPSQPVFDPATLGDNRLLDSFSMTVKHTETGNGTVTENQDTINYIKTPFNAYQLEVNNGDSISSYWVGDWMVTNQGDGHWSIEASSDPAQLRSFQNSADMRQNGGVSSLKSARFVGQKNFNGIPANHFDFDQTDLTDYGVPNDNDYKIDKAQGDLYLAQDSNVVLYFHSKVTGNVYRDPAGLNFLSGAEESTEELSSIGQVKETALPAEYLALKLEPDLGLPLPADTKFASLEHYTPLQGGDIYDYKTSVSQAAFIQFYKDLAPTDGWTVTQIGLPIEKYELCVSGACVVLKKGHAQIVLHREVSPFNGSIDIIGYYAK